MFKKLAIYLSLVLFMLVFSPVLLAAEPEADAEADATDDPWAYSRLGTTELGEVWFGPPLEKEDLRGQVVLLEKWGFRCPPCIASIPHLAKLHSRYGRRGLVVIGAHAQGAYKGKALSVALEHGANYTILSKATVPNDTGRGIPRVFVFNHNGKVIYEGYPNSKMDRAIMAALKRRPHPLLGDMKYKKMPAAAGMVKAGRLGKAYNECEKNKDAEGQLGKEAAFLLANLQRYADRLESKANGDCPIAVMQALTELTKRFAATEYSRQAAAKLAELADDEEFQTELKAEQAYLPIARAASVIPPLPAGKSDRAIWKRKYGGRFSSVKAKVEQLNENYPETTAARKAEKLIEEITGL